MAVLHRALFTWFVLLTFLILMGIKIDDKLQWNWFIVFMPMWVYDNILLMYIGFNMILYFKNAHDHSIRPRRLIWYLMAILLKLIGQVLICLKLEAVQWELPAKVVLGPFVLLFGVLSIDVFIHLIQHSRY